MSNRTAKFVSAIFASLLAGIPLATASPGAAAECLAGPKDQTPDGSHWHYRIEHPSERHCWYLRKADEALSRLAAPNSPPAAKPALPKTEPPIQRSIANAHAEVLQSAPTPQPVPAPAVTENTPPATGVANLPTSTIASRWPGQPDTNSSFSPQPVSPQALAASPVANTPSNLKMPAPRAIAAVALATADSSSKKQFGSVQMWLTVAMGAMSLAAVMGGALSRFSGKRWTGKRENRGPRRVNWGSHGVGDPTLSAHRTTGRPGGNIQRDPRAADDPNRRIAEMLAQLSRNAAA